MAGTPHEIRSDMDFNQNQAIRMVFENSATAPISPVDGQIYYDTGLDSIRIYQGGVWVSYDAGPVSVGLLSERPAAGVEGALFYTTDENVLYVDDGSTWRIVGDDADANTLDGLNSSQFLRSDVNDTASGDITFTGRAFFEGGSVSAPGISFAADSNTGLYQTGTNDNHIRFAVSGVTPMVLSSSELTISGSKVWHAGNDGSGSGLDADLLDGINGASLLRSDTDDTYSGGVLRFTNDAGAFIDGGGNKHAAEAYQATVGADAFMGFHVSGDFGAYFGVSGALNDFVVGGWSMGANVYRLWHAGNDGTGSGLDADLLDGSEGASYYRSEISSLSSGDFDSIVTHGTHRINNLAGFTNVPTLENGSTAYAWGILSVEVFGSTYVKQTYTSDQSGHIVTRIKWASSWRPWIQVWTGGQSGYAQGSLSGLDADMLDSVHSTGFLRRDVNDSVTAIPTFTGTRVQVDSGTPIVMGGGNDVFYGLNVASLKQNVANTTGAIVVRWNRNGQNQMTKLRLHGYLYDNTYGTTIDVTAAAYARPDGSGFLNAEHYISSGSRHPRTRGNGGADVTAVRWAQEVANGNIVLIIGDVTSVWQYPQLFVDVLLGYTPTVDDLDGWSITIETSLAAFDSVNTPTEAYGFITTGGSVDMTLDGVKVSKVGHSHTVASDGTPPSSSPTPSLTGGPGYLIVSWDGITNDDLVVYEVHLSTSSGFTPTSGTLVGKTAATNFVTTVADSSKNPLVYGVAYYAKIIATDPDGAAAAGAVSSQGSMVQILAEDIGDDVITAAHILAGTITANEIAANTITAAKIAAGTITASEIAAGTITANKIAANTLTANEIAANAITTSELNAGAVTAAKIAANTITANEIAASTITSTQIAADTITAGNIAANAVSTSELAANAVTAAKITAGTITSTQIAADTITAGNIAANAITSSELSANSVIAGKIAANAVTATTIASSAITTDKLAANAVTASKLLVTVGGENQLRNSSFEENDLSGYSISPNMEASFSTDESIHGVRSLKMRPTTITGDRYVATPYEMDGDVLAGQSVTLTYWMKGNVAHTTTGGPSLQFGSGGSYLASTTYAVPTTWTKFTYTWSVPSTDAGKFARIVFRASNDDTTDITYYDQVQIEVGDVSTSWKPQVSELLAGTILAEHLSANSVTAAAIAANTITATEIAANTITATQIAANTLTANEIAANAITASEINAGAVTTAKLDALAVTADKIAANTITAAKIAAGTITATEIAANTITASQIAANTITASQIAANTITASQIAASTITATQIASNAITAAKISSNAVTAVKISAGVVDATKLAANAVTASKLSALYIESGKYIRSTSYTAGVSGWSIEADGSAEFNNVLARGAFYTDTSGSGSYIIMGDETDGTIELYSDSINEVAPGRLFRQDDPGFESFASTILTSGSMSGGTSSSYGAYLDLTTNTSGSETATLAADDILFDAPTVRTPDGEILDVADFENAAWVSYTPVATGINLGSGGTINGRYLRIGDLVICQGGFTLGSGGSGGTTTMQPGLPITAKQFAGNVQRFIGVCYYRHVGNRSYVGSCVASGGALILVHTESGNGGSCNGSWPFGWSNSHNASWTIVYEVA